MSAETAKPERRRDAHEEDECLLCAPASHSNCEMYTVVEVLDPSVVPLGEEHADHLVSIPVCAAHYETITQYRRGKNVEEVVV